MRYYLFLPASAALVSSARAGPACEAVSLSQSASSLKKNFICAGDALVSGLSASPLAVLVYVAAVLLVALLVFRSANSHKNHHQDQD